MCGGMTFNLLVKRLNAHSVAERISSLARILPTQLLALTLFSKPIIDLVFDLKEVRGSLVQTNHRSVHEFGPHKKLVENLLRCSRKALRHVEDQTHFSEMRTLVNKLMSGEKVEHTFSKHEDGLAQMFSLLLKRYHNQRAVSLALGMRHSTIGNALRGQASEKDTARVFEGCKRLLKIEVLKEPADRPNEAAPEDSQKEYEGETSKRGVRFVLGPKSFKQLEVEISLAPPLINLIKGTVEQCRRLLTLATQINDDKVRGAVRQSVLSKEIEELELAIRLFSQMYPNKLLELNNQQREFWATVNKEKR